MTTKLPDAVNAGDEIEVQLAPRGAYPQIVDGKEVVQIVDDAAVKSLIDNFNAEKAAAKERGENYQVLVDADHSSETGDTTKAMAWIDRIFDDPDRGLVGVFVFTKEGADAVSGKAYRFISPAWTLTDDGHPEKLVSVGMTNRPNLPVSPMLNMKAAKSPKAGTAVANSATDGVTPKEGERKADGVEAQNAGEENNPAAAPSGDAANNQEGTSTMDIKAKLGLPAEATDEEVEQALDAVLAKCGGMEQVQNALGLEPTCANEDVLAAVNAVLEQSEALQNAQGELDKMKTAQRNAEADELVKANADVIPEEDAEAVKAQYASDPEAAKETVANMRRVYERAVANAQRSAAAVKKSVSINFRTAKAPVALNMEAILANCGGDPAKENEMLRAMGAK